MESREIILYSRRYLLSETGNLTLLSDKGNRELKPYLGTLGYYTYCIRMGNKYQPVYVHRLLATEFLPNPHNKPCVNHIDGNRNNNSLSNLEWTTTKENNSHALNVLKTNFKTMKYKGFYKMGNKFCCQVRENKVAKYLGTFNTREEARERFVSYFEEKHGFKPNLHPITY